MSPRRTVTAIVLALASAAGGAACGSSTTPTSEVTLVGDAEHPADVADASVAAPAPTGGAADSGVGSLGDAVEVAAGAPGEADAAACSMDRQLLETAAVAYEALNGSLPTSETDLVTGGLIKEVSPRFDITVDGTIVATPGGACT